MNADEDFFDTESDVGGTQVQSRQFRTVEDACSYLEQLQHELKNQPQVYNEFLDIMREYKSESIDTPDVIQRVLTLFRGHPDLIVGFNAFLPPGFKLEVEPYGVRVSIPDTNSDGGTTSANTSLTINAGQPSIKIIHSTHSSESNHSSHSAPSSSSLRNALNEFILKRKRNIPQPPHIVKLVSTQAYAADGTPITVWTSQSYSNQATMLGIQSMSQVSNHTPPVANSQPHTNSQNQHVYNQNTPSFAQSSGGSYQAIRYVNKIKNRFQAQPSIYKRFLALLHRYQTEQSNLKEGISVPNPLTAAEVYAQVTRLFQNQDDLIEEFEQFQISNTTGAD